MPVIRLQNGNGDNNIHYEFDPTQAPLGEGGMGRVFCGVQVDESNGASRTREVAIKLLFDDLPDHAIQRARREASIRIKNDNLVEMIDFVENVDNITHSVHYHVVSELLNGVNLYEMFEGKTTNHDGSSNPAAERLLATYNSHRKYFVGEVFRSVLSGIVALHDAGYIHRDIDPSNIVVTADGKIKLIDFGIAKRFNELGSFDKQLTSAGQFVGKTHYAAPELLLGDLQHQNRTTDIYSLGIMLFQLVVGHLPFDGPFQEVYEKQLHEKLPLKEVEDRTVRRIIEKATEKDQRKRYQSASEFRVDIDRWMTQNTADERESLFKPEASVSRHKPVSDNKAVKKIALAAAGLLVVALVTYLVVRGGGKSTPVTETTPPAETVIADNPTQVITQEVEPPVQEEPVVEEKESVDRGVALLKAGDAEGVAMLENLASQGDQEAVFMMSRLLHAPTNRPFEIDEEDWKQMRQNSNLGTDDKKAHEYLMGICDPTKASGNQEDYKWYYQLGCDFLYGSGIPKKDWSQAKWCFEKALNRTKEVGLSAANEYYANCKDVLDNALRDKQSTNPFNTSD